MANPEHLAILRGGVEKWNWWRKRDREILVPDLTEISMREAALVGANLRRADLTGSDLRGADLRDADFERC